MNGWLVLVCFLFAVVFALLMMIFGIRMQGPSIIIPGALLEALLFSLILPGFFTLQPNQARVLILFGKYVGTVRQTGFHWGNPFYSNGRMLATAETTPTPSVGSLAAKRNLKSASRNKISLRSRNMNGEKLKVNDKRGNPVEISAVIVWRVEDTAKAMFDVDDYEQFVTIQSESAVRHLATSYAYDDGEHEQEEITLRSNAAEISVALQAELQDRLNRAGVVIEEARLNHLAYAPEIASVMLRRQQAEAVIAAREKIVLGSVSMVEMALGELSRKNVIELDDERKAAMVSNLLVVLCSDSEAQPVVNTGTLYH
ncbi:MAG: SPFH domain-containing protein [Verrucomicrobiota bacterium]|nr:SPFH domain-containing protein [Verrucomicrobiota bacterium]